MQITALKWNKEFRRLYFRGRYKTHPLLVTYLMKNGLGINRVGITTGKKVGRAVDRSRARRVIRAAWAEVSPAFPLGYDFVFVARQGTPEVKSGQLARVMKGQVLTLLEGKAPRKEKADAPVGLPEGQAEPEAAE